MLLKREFNKDSIITRCYRSIIFNHNGLTCKIGYKQARNIYSIIDVLNNNINNNIKGKIYIY